MNQLPCLPHKSIDNVEKDGIVMFSAGVTNCNEGFSVKQERNSKNVASKNSEGEHMVD